MTHPFSDLLERSNKPSRTLVGLMSGTSADSIDVAVCRMNGRGTEVSVKLLLYQECEHDPEVNRQVRGAADLSVRALAELNMRVGEAFAAACPATLHEAGLTAEDADLMATLTEFVARTIAIGLKQCAEIGPPVEQVIVAGGGVKNPVLMERIEALLAPIPVRRSDDVGVPADAREAMAFAVLADMTLRGLAAWLPPVTGATAPKLLGKLSFP